MSTRKTPSHSPPLRTKAGPVSTSRPMPSLLPGSLTGKPLRNGASRMNGGPDRRPGIASFTRDHRRAPRRSGGTRPFCRPNGKRLEEHGGTYAILWTSASILFGSPPETFCGAHTIVGVAGDYSACGLLRNCSAGIPRPAAEGVSRAQFPASCRCPPGGGAMPTAAAAGWSPLRAQ